MSLTVRRGRPWAQVVMDGYEPSRLDPGDVRSQRGEKEWQRAPEDTNILFFIVRFYLFFLCSNAASQVFWYYNGGIFTIHLGVIYVYHINMYDHYVFE